MSGSRIAPLVVVSAALLLGGARAAHAADTCLTAPVEGQKHQRAGRLLDAKKSFTSCARESCPREVVQACTRWEHEVEASLPSVVLAARDEAGRDLPARVAIDGAEATSLGLRALPLDPGPHRFVFTREGAAPVEESIVLREGEKNRVVTAVFAAPRKERPPLAPSPSPPPAPAPSWWTPLRTTGAVVGGAGAVALVSGLVVALVAKSSYDAARAQCDAPDDCPRDAVTRSDDARSLGDVATVLVAAGAGVSAIGVGILLFAPASREPRSLARLDLDASPLSLRMTARW